MANVLPSNALSKRSADGFRALKSKSLAPVWCLLASLMLAAAWLLPNHAQPWLSFQSEAWMAVVTTVIGVVVLTKSRELSLTGLDLILALAVPLPFVHYAIGLVPFAGQAWTSSAFLLGALLAVLVGRQWNSWKPLWMGDVLFGGFLVAAIASAGLQLYQWMWLASERGIFDIWVFGFAQDRPYANLAQPNLTATLLLWGILASGWGVHRGHMGRAAAAAAVTLLVFGIALTQSRSGLLGLFAIGATAFWWRKLWPDRRLVYGALALVPLHLVCVQASQWLSTMLLFGNAGTMVTRTMGEVRPMLWAMEIEAIFARPWLGYGWNQALAAHLELAEHYPDLPALFVQTHNLFLDFIVWAGLPIGLLMTGACVAWAVSVLTRVRTAEQAMYVMVLAVVGLHSMVELPLHYAYFLLPTCLVAGALSGQLQVWPILGQSRALWGAGVALFAGAAALLIIIVDDYFQVETTTFRLRMQFAGKPLGPTPPPDVKVLTQFRSILDASLLQSSSNFSGRDLERARDVTSVVITYRNLSNLTLVLALHGHVPEAQCWMAKANVLMPDAQVPFLKGDWKIFQSKYPQLQTVGWPESHEAGALCGLVRDSRLGPYTQYRW